MNAADAIPRRLAVVSGGSRGLGRSIGERLIEDGWSVATFSRRTNEFVEDITRRFPDQFIWRAVDITDHDAVRRYVTDTAKRFGRIDVLVNNAGLLDGQELFLTTSAHRIEQVIASNLSGPIVLTHSCARVMGGHQGGQIVNVSSINAVRGFRGVAVYSAAKAGMDGFTRSLARELGPLNIRVNSVAPGFFDSELTVGVTDTNRDRIQRRTPLGRLAGLGEVTDAVLYLMSDRSSFITGQTIVVDGGITC